MSKVYVLDLYPESGKVKHEVLGIFTSLDKCKEYLLSHIDLTESDIESLLTKRKLIVDRLYSEYDSYYITKYDLDRV